MQKLLLTIQVFIISKILFIVFFLYFAYVELLSSCLLSTHN